MTAATTLFGSQHQENLKWLSDAWWETASPVCILQGFPGVGKTQIADALEDSLNGRWRVVRCQCPPRGVGVLDDLVLTLASQFSSQRDDRLANSPSPLTLLQLLQERVLIVVDEFQESFAADSPKPAEVLAKWIEQTSSRRDLQGRILFLSSR